MVFLDSFDAVGISESTAAANRFIEKQEITQITHLELISLDKTSMLTAQWTLNKSWLYDHMLSKIVTMLVWLLQFFTSQGIQPFNKYAMTRLVLAWWIQSSSTWEGLFRCISRSSIFDDNRSIRKLCLVVVGHSPGMRPTNVFHCTHRAWLGHCETFLMWRIHTVGYLLYRVPHRKDNAT